MAIVEQIAFYLGAAFLIGFIFFIIFEALLRAYDTVSSRATRDIAAGEPLKPEAVNMQANGETT